MTVSKREQAQVAARRARVLELRAQGMTLRDIAADPAVNLPSEQHAAMDVTRALQDARRSLDRQAKLFTALETERLNGLERDIRDVMTTAADADDGLMVLRCADRLLRVSERRARLLGMDVPPALTVRNAPPAPEPPKAANGFDQLADRRAKRRNTG